VSLFFCPTGRNHFFLHVCFADLSGAEGSRFPHYLSIFHRAYLGDSCSCPIFFVDSFSSFITFFHVKCGRVLASFCGSASPTVSPCLRSWLSPQFQFEAYKIFPIHLPHAIISAWPLLSSPSSQRAGTHISFPFLRMAARCIAFLPFSSSDSVKLLELGFFNI